jgi:hypothetical protein
MGTVRFINPLFYDEFSDPDLIRVGDSPGPKSDGSDGDRFDWSSTPPDSPP